PLPLREPRDTALVVRLRRALAHEQAAQAPGSAGRLRPRRLRVEGAHRHRPRRLAHPDLARLPQVDALPGPAADAALPLRVVRDPAGPALPLLAPPPPCA